MMKIDFSFLVPHFSPRNEKLKKTENENFSFSVPPIVTNNIFLKTMTGKTKSIYSTRHRFDYYEVAVERIYIFPWNLNLIFIMTLVAVVHYWPPKIIWNFTRTDELENVSQLNTEKCRHCIVYYTIPTTAAAYITFFSWNRNYIGYIMLLYTRFIFIFRTKSVGFDETEFGAGISGCVQ